MYHGIINVYKEQGYTSFDVVAKLRGILGQQKIGHTGTLDPAAEGVLPICLGNATKVTDMLVDRDKIYRAVLLLGVETDTQDTTGTVLTEGSLEGITPEQVEETILSFVGEGEQIPPMYSALKVNGQRLYDLARQGRTVDRRPRRINIYRINIEEIDLPRVTMTIRCSKGTYIRTICHDVGEKLGCHGALEHLVRIVSGGHQVEDSLTLSEIEALQKQGTLADRIHSIESVFGTMPLVQTNAEADRLLYNGNALYPNNLDKKQRDTFFALETIFDSGMQGPSYVTPRYRVRDSKGRFCAVYELHMGDKVFKPAKMFLPEETN